MKAKRLRTLLATVLMAGMAGSVGDVAGARAQATTPPPANAGPAVGGDTSDGESARVGRNYDYFTANLNPGLASYLSQVTARHASERVWAQYRSGKLVASVEDCRYTLERFPNHPRALHLIGEIAKVMNESSLAIPFYEYALSLYPQYAFTHAQYGNFLIDIGAVSAGVGQLREALRIEPNQFQAQAWLTQALAAHPELARETPPSEGAKGSTPNPPKTSQPPSKTAQPQGSR